MLLKLSGLLTLASTVLLFHQSDWILTFERMELFRHNEKYVTNCNIFTTKYNRTMPVVNATFTYTKDLNNDIQVIVQAYKFMSNEYRLFPLRFQFDFCNTAALNDFGLGGFYKCGNFTKCPVKKILLATSPPRFQVELLRVNSSNTLLVVAGSSGVLVLELPERCPPHGAFANNKEIIYCRSHNLDEQLLCCNPHIEVRQVRFHPASKNNTHILVLTSDNALRLYNIENQTAVALKVCSVGQRPMGVLPGTKSFFLGLLGETAVDFDFGPPELSSEQPDLEEDRKVHPLLHSILKSSNKALLERKAAETHEALRKQSIVMKLTGTASKENLQWPIFLLNGDDFVYMINIDLYDDQIQKPRGPLPIRPRYDNKSSSPSCAILCQPSTPPVLCIATTNGTIYHSIVLPIDPADETLKNLHANSESSDAPDRAMYIFEGLGLELGLAVSDSLQDYCCPIFLHADESRPGHYFATHEGGVHAVTMPALETLQKYVKGPGDDNVLQLLLNQPSTADYLVCTKMSSSKKIEPVIGFAIYYDPTSIIALLAKGQIVSTLVVSFTSLPCTDDFMPEDIEDFNSPLKKMLSEPFDLKIQRILKQASSQPILKIAGSGEGTQQECYELLQRAAQVFRDEYFKHHEEAREEIHKRIKVLQMLKRCQTNELRKLNEQKQNLQETAESLAEKYEDIKDKQEDLKKRCEKLLILVSHKKAKPSEAEQIFLGELKVTQNKIKAYIMGVNNLRQQTKYQEVQLENWKQDQLKKETGLGSIQSEVIKTNLQDMTNKITEMMNDVTEYKKQLALN